MESLGLDIILSKSVVFISTLQLIQMPRRSHTYSYPTTINFVRRMKTHVPRLWQIDTWIVWSILIKYDCSWCIVPTRNRIITVSDICTWKQLSLGTSYHNHCLMKVNEVTKWVQELFCHLNLWVLIVNCWLCSQSSCF